MSFLEKIGKISKFSIAITFLSLEVFAFIAFSFGGSFLFFAILSLVLAVLLVLFNINELKNKDYSSMVFYLFPIFMFGLLIALGTYMKGHRIVDGEFTMAETVFVPIGLTSMAIVGCALANDKSFKISHLLLVIYGALSVLVLINLFANLINFGPFYNIIYKGYYMYFSGKKSSLPVQNMAYALEGFKIIEVDIKHYLLYPILLLSSHFMLFNVSFKQEKRIFITYLIYTSVAVLALVFVPNIIGLAFAVLSLLIDGIIFLFKKVERARKPILWVIRIGFVLAILLLLIMILLNQDATAGIRNVVSSNSFLNRLFLTNGVVSKYNITLQNIIGENFLGFYYYKTNQYLTPDIAPLSNSFIFDSFMVSGVIGALALFIFLFVGFRSFKKYFVSNKDEYRYQAMLLVFLVIFFLYSALYNVGEYGIYYSVNKPFFISGPFMIAIAILAYVFAKSLPEKKVDEKKDNQVEETNSDEK